jgi:hypothetical protein
VIRSFDPGRKHKRSGINSLGSFAPRTHLSKPGHLLLSLSPYSSSVVVSFHFSYEVEGNLFNVVHPFLDLRGAIAPTSSGVRRPCAMALRFSTSSCLFREHIYQNPDISCHFRPLKARLSCFLQVHLGFEEHVTQIADAYQVVANRPFNVLLRSPEVGDLGQQFGACPEDLQSSAARPRRVRRPGSS